MCARLALGLNANRNRPLPLRKRLQPTRLWPAVQFMNIVVLLVHVVVLPSATVTVPDYPRTAACFYAVRAAQISQNRLELGTLLVLIVLTSLLSSNEPLMRVDIALIGERPLYPHLPTSPSRRHVLALRSACAIRWNGSCRDNCRVSHRSAEKGSGAAGAWPCRAHTLFHEAVRPRLNLPPARLSPTRETPPRARIGVAKP